MSGSERKEIADYYKRYPPKVDAVHRATKETLIFHHTYLPHATPENGIDEYEEDGKKIWERDVVRGNSNMNYHDVLLAVPTSEIDSPSMVQPETVKTSSKGPLLTSEGRYAGLTEFYFYYFGKYRQLQQGVALTKIESSIGTELDWVEIKRTATPRIGDVTYGMISLNNKSTLEPLDIQKTNHDNPVFLTFVDGKVLATTYFSRVLKEIEPEELKEIGISATYTNGPDNATFKVASGELSVTLQMGKTLQNGYPEILFSPDERWITDSSIFVGQVPTAMLN